MESDGEDELDSHNSRRSPIYKDSAVGGGGYDAHQLPRAMSNRTLLDVIRDEGGGSKESKKTWRHFKDKLKGRGSVSGGRGSTWTSTVPVPASDIPMNNNKNRMMSRHPSTRINPVLDSDPISQPDISAVPDARCSSLLRTPSRPMERASGRFDFDGPMKMERASGRFDFDGPMKRLQREENEEEEEEDEEEAHSDNASEGGKEGPEGGGEEQRPVRMSLMSLLAETDEDGIGYGMGDDEDDDEDDDDDGGGLEYNNCCICMVRHKGTAFEPCGHSFCRLCSREMWVQGGNCPLCNNYILEILDIF